MAAVTDVSNELVGETGLADPGLTDESDDAPVAGEAVECLTQLPQLRVAADEDVRRIDRRWPHRRRRGRWWSGQ